MVFRKIFIAGVWEVEPQPIEDERGSFARIACNEEFEKNGLPANFSQSSFSWNRLAGTLRGMHFQKKPYGEHKLVRCTRGAIYDVVVDLRPDSPNYRQWHGRELTAKNRIAMYLSPGIAHGFITLEPDTEVLYMMREPYQPGYDAGVNWADPAFGIKWPLQPVCMSARDANYPFL